MEIGLIDGHRGHINAGHHINFRIIARGVLGWIIAAGNFNSYIVIYYVIVV